tara:strand:- start:2432 stop:4135 length:1704 start_codon:yes stop_codon:yes gene_type:complete
MKSFNLDTTVTVCGGTPQEPINVSNSNDTYVVDTLVDLELPDITVTDSDGTVATVPSMENVVCTPSGQTSVRVSNSDDTYDVTTSVDLELPDSSVSNSNNSYVNALPATEDLALPNINFTDSDGTVTSVPSMEDIVATPFYTIILADGNTVLWVDSQENVTKDASNLVSVWGDKSGEGNDLLQATGSAQPLWSTNGILFDGVNDFMKAAAFTLVQPEMVYFVFKQVSWTLNDRIYDGDISPSMLISQASATPALNMYGGGSLNNANLPLNTFGIVRCLYDGANSKFIINDTTPITGNVGTNNAGGFTLARKGDLNANFGNIEVKEIIIRKVADSATGEALIYQYLSDKYLPTAEEVLTDGSTVLWVDSEENVTKNGANHVSIWGDKSGQGNDLLQATGASQPLYSTNGILFDGVNDFLKAAAFTLVQPEMIYIVFKQVTWSFSTRVFDGDSTNAMVLSQFQTTPSLNMQVSGYSSSLSVKNTNLPVNTFGIARCLYDGVNSKFIIDDTTPVTGSVSTLSAGGFSLGARGSNALHSNIEVKEVIIRKVADSAGDEALIYKYLSDKYGI